ncbi:MAG: hypothetical protein R3266_04855, partial [Gemmatimonadota bacterium]|nr:hypothetical protein [Gemmatimonadota bacterium]
HGDPSLSPDTESFPSLPGEGEPRVYRLRLVNRLAGPATVFASAGARRVVLDTVPAGDSLLVDIRLRADRVDLEAEDDRGRRVAAAGLDLVGDDVNRWVIAAVSDVGSSPRTVLVRDESPGYRRSRPE